MSFQSKANYNKERAEKPKNHDLNYLEANRYKIIIDSLKYPNAQFTCQDVNLPEIEANSATMATPRTNLRLASDKVMFSPFAMQFIVDEEMINYKEIYHWVVGQAMVDDFNTKKYRDLTLQIFSSNNNLLKEIIFVDAIPTRMSGLELTTTEDNVQHIVCNVIFNFSYFYFKEDFATSNKKHVF